MRPNWVYPMPGEKGVLHVFRQIIVGLDGSEKSKKAAHIACDLAKHYAGTITLMHVPHAETAEYLFASDAEYDGANPNPTFEEIEEAGQRVIDAGLQIADNMGCTSVNTHMPHGDPATEILAYADKIEADLIVTGRRGLGGISSLVLGSTTQRINHMAKCGCLSVM